MVFAFGMVKYFFLNLEYYVVFLTFANHDKKKKKRIFLLNVSCILHCRHSQYNGYYDKKFAGFVAFP